MIGKELHLYGLPLALAGLFAVSWILLTNFESDSLQLLDVQMLTRGLVGVYVGIVTLLVTSSASAEERQLGTLAGETLLPISNRTRWRVKVAVSAGVVFALGLAVPLALAVFFPGTNQPAILADGLLGGVWRRGGIFSAFFAGFAGVVGVFALSLYVSSLVTGGLRALLASIAAIAMIPFAMSLVAEVSLRVAQQLTQWIGLDHRSWLTRLLVDDRFRDRFSFYWWLPTALAAVFLILVLRYASQNHSSFERPAAAFRRQAIRLVAFVALAVSVLTVVSGVTSAAFMARWNERQSQRAVEQPDPARAQPSDINR